MALPSFPTLTKRTVKGVPLTHAEGDLNLDEIKGYCEMLASLFGVSLNPDGTLNADSVTTNSLVDRSVTLRKLASVSSFLAEDIGSTNALAIAFTPPLTAYEEKQLFWVHVANTNTDGITLKVDSLAATEVRKLDNRAIEAGDVREGDVIGFAYFAPYFKIVARSSAASASESGGSSSGFSGITQYESELTVIPGSGDPATSFVHGLAAAPNDYKVWLVCVDTDAGVSAQVAVGDRVPIALFTDTDGIPAFNVAASDYEIKVKTMAASIDLGLVGTIDPTKWNLLVVASNVTSVAAQIFPALTMTVVQPEGVMAHNDDIFFMHRGRDLGTVHTANLKLSTNTIIQLDPAASNPNHRAINAAKFEMADGTRGFVFTSSLGTYWLPIVPGSPWRPEQLTTAGTSAQKPVHIIESTGISEVYTASSEMDYNTVGSFNVKRIVVGANTNNNYGTAIDFRNAAILNASGVAGNEEFRKWHLGSSATVVFFQYNQINKRIYMATSETMLLNIFQIQTAADFKAWWDLAVGDRYTDLKYIKSISIPGDGAAWADNAREHMFIDFDLDTGDERAILFTRTGRSDRAGSITRAVWKE